MWNTHTLQLQCAGAVKAAVVSQLEWIPHSCLWNQWLLFHRKNAHTHTQHSVWEKTHTLLSPVRPGETVPPPLLSKPSPFLSSTLPNETRVEPQAKRDHYNMAERFCAILLFEQAELKSFMPYMVSYCKNITVNTQKHTCISSPVEVAAWEYYFDLQHISNHTTSYIKCEHNEYMTHNPWSCMYGAGCYFITSSL